jgi:endonuclease YncB( thermonuclease family)
MPDCLSGPADVIDGDIIIVADQLVRLRGIDAPELDQTFWWRGQPAPRCRWLPSMPL